MTPRPRSKPDPETRRLGLWLFPGRLWARVGAYGCTDERAPAFMDLWHKETLLMAGPSDPEMYYARDKAVPDRGGVGEVQGDGRVITGKACA